MFSWYGDVGKNAAVLLSLSIILFSGFLVTRLTKLCRLPNVSGFILAGVLIGPGVLNLVPKNIMDDMGFVSDIALAFIAFGVGKFFKKKAIKRTGKGVIAVTLFEALLAGLLVTLSVKAL
ncbi:MAG: cation:proton antiporter, partial [Oscillospiraceae bacterium]